MSKQYYQDNENLIDDLKTISYYGHKELTFQTNSGLFAKDKIDYYSIILVDVINSDFNQELNSYLDLGCGYGFIGIALAQIFPHTNKYFIDINKRAIEYTKINIKRNNVENAFVYQSDGIQLEQTFDLIALNPPIHAGKQVMYNLYHQAYNHLSDIGSLYIVLAKKHGALSTIKDLETVFAKVVTVYKKKGLFVIRITK
jgi:16S rRNA (guanine1207-N2)-methyltransferase